MDVRLRNKIKGIKGNSHRFIQIITEKNEFRGTGNNLL
jgi:hypothetical protein